MKTIVISGRERRGKADSSTTRLAFPPILSFFFSTIVESEPRSAFEHVSVYITMVTQRSLPPPPLFFILHDTPRRLKLHEE